MENLILNMYQDKIIVSVIIIKKNQVVVEI